MTTRPARTQLLLECAGLAAIGLVWRGAYLLRMGGLWRDELYSAFSTFAAVELTAVPPFLVETDYVLPVASLVGVPLRAAGLEAMLWIRLPHMLASLAAAAIWHCVIRRYLPRLPAALTSCWLLVGNSAVLLYSTAAISYGVVQLGLASLVLLTLRYGDRPKRRRAAALSVLAALNVTHYALTAVVVLPALASVIFSWEQWRNAASILRKTSRRSLYLGGIATVLATSGAALAVYRPLTQGRFYRGGSIEVIAGSAALCLAVVAALSLRGALANLVSRDTYRRGIWLFLPGLLSAVLFNAYVRWYVGTVYPSWDANTASWGTLLRNMHEYAGQVRLFLEGVLPAYLLGDLPTLAPGVVSYDQLGVAAIPSVFFLASVALGLWTLIRRFSAELPEIGWLLCVPLLLLVLVPSWKLFGDYSFRYLLICSGPFALCAVSGIHFLTDSRLVTAVIVGSITLYGGLDGWRNVPAAATPEWQQARRQWTILGGADVEALVTADASAPYVRIAANRRFAVYDQSTPQFRFILTGGTSLCDHEKIALSASVSPEKWPFPTEGCEFDEVRQPLPNGGMRIMRRLEGR